MTLNDLTEGVDQALTDLHGTGEARISLDKWGERSLCKNIIKKVTEDLDTGDYEASFDGDENEFVVRLTIPEPETEEADEDDVPF